MRIGFKEILSDHYKKTGEYITQVEIAREMVEKGLFKNIHSAQNMIQYNINGKSKSLDVELLRFLCERFNKNLSEIIFT